MPRHLAIGDIHGCYNALRTLCDFVELRDDDVLVTLGDYVNRGPNTCAVLDWLIHQQRTRILRPLRGNHEIMTLNALNSDEAYRRWLRCGGDLTLRSYAPFEGDRGSLADIPDSHWEFIQHQLLPYFETPTHFFVHANSYPDIPLEEQPEFMLYWEDYDNPPIHQSGKIMVCGHNSQKSGLPVTNGHAVCIDTWAWGTGWLTCLHAESGQIWQANQIGQTRKMWLDEV